MIANYKGGIKVVTKAKVGRLGREGEVKKNRAQGREGGQGSRKGVHWRKE